MHKLRVIYAGTPEFAVPALKTLHVQGHDVAVVLTQPDRPAGRGQKLVSSPVKRTALDLGLEVWQPLSLRKADIKKKLRSLKADVMVVAAYGLILPQSVLDMPRMGSINIHASLLPRWRGAAPIHRAIEAGDQETGITIMQMDAGLDTGDILSLRKIPILSTDTTATLHDQLADLGAELLVDTLEKLCQEKITPLAQNHDLATYADKLKKSEAQLNWEYPAEQLALKVRAFNPWPCAYTLLDGQHFKIWKAEVADHVEIHNITSKPQLSNIKGQVIVSNKHGIYVQTGSKLLKITELQMAGKKRLSHHQFIQANDLTGRCFGA